jgi:NADH-quinone oxidoreductase subunit C
VTVKESQASAAVQAAIDRVREAQAARIVRLGLHESGMIGLEVRPEDLLAVAQFLRDDPALDFRYFSFMFGVDRGDHFQTVYVLDSLVTGVRLQISVKLDANDPKVDSVTGIWRGANWHERETYDMFGITFVGHPYHFRMFMEEDFEGFPMRKSYKLAGRAD